MTSKKFNARHGMSVGSTPIDVIDSSGLISSASIPNLDAAKITSGTIDAARLPSYVDSVAGKTGTVTLAKADVGLGSVDNTSDAAKPVSTETQTALDLKANLASPTFTGTVSGITAAMVGLADVENKSSATIRGEITSGNVTGALGFTPQDQLVSGINIKTVNGNSLLGSGDITISGGGGGGSSGFEQTFLLMGV